ncbi:MAG: rhodanese-like domain-containing protein [Limisphaerales bacterium]
MQKKSAKLSTPSAGFPWRGLLGRASMLVVLGCGLGFAFNASSPLGIRWEPTGSAPAATPSTASVAAAPISPPSRSTPTDAASPLPGAIDTATANAMTPEAANASTSPIHWVEVSGPLSRGELLLVDARTRPVYEAGHIPGAVCLPEDSSHEELLAFREKFGTERHTVIYCSSLSCSLSFKLAYKLIKDYGFRHVQYMTGGYQEWQRETGLAPTVEPTSTLASASTANSTPPGVSPAGTATTASSSTSPSPTPSPTANPHPISWAKVDEWLNNRKAILVDARSEEEYRAGHVPGAISLPENATPDQLATFRQQFGPDRSIIVYGDVGGSMKAFLAGRQLTRKEGFTSVRFVTEGYKEWLANQALTPRAAK